MQEFTSFDNNQELVALPPGFLHQHLQCARHPRVRGAWGSLNPPPEIQVGNQAWHEEPNPKNLKISLLIN